MVNKCCVVICGSNYNVEETIADIIFRVYENFKKRPIPFVERKDWEPFKSVAVSVEEFCIGT